MRISRVAIVFAAVPSGVAVRCVEQATCGLQTMDSTTLRPAAAAAAARTALSPIDGGGVVRRRNRLKSRHLPIPESDDVRLTLQNTALTIIISQSQV